MTCKERESGTQELLFLSPDYTTYTNIDHHGRVHNVLASAYSPACRQNRAFCGPDCFIGQSTGTKYHQHPCKLKQDGLEAY
jgi:hypothetical protein